MSGSGEGIGTIRQGLPMNQQPHGRLGLGDEGQDGDGGGESGRRLAAAVNTYLTGKPAKRIDD